MEIRRTWLDRAIDWVSPKWGFERVRARKLSEIMLGYEGARKDRGTEGWRTTDSSANTEIGPNVSLLRQRSRDLVRNNAYGARAVAELAGQAIGTGIRAVAKPADGDKVLAGQINDAWKIWTDECDAEGQLDFYGLQRLAARTVVESGECLVRLRPRFTNDGYHVPMQIQVLEPDYLDTWRTEQTKTGRIIQGVEFDLLGKRIGYWLYPEHPGDMMASWVTASPNYTSKKIPSSLILHVYQKDRQQVRGVPWFAPVVISMRDLDEYSEAELVRKKIEACFATFVTQPEAAEGPSIGEVKTDGEQRIESVEPGMIRYLAPGEEVTFGTPTSHGEGFRDFMVDVKSRIASGVGLTYEQLTGDLSNVNYSSYRAGLLSFRTGMDAFRWLTFIPMFCGPVRRWFIDAAFAAGRISRRDYGTQWSPPGYGSVDPLRDANASRARIRMGLQTWPQAVAEEGYDPEEQVEEIRESNEAMDNAGIVLDSDPRKRTSAGNAVTASAPSAAENPAAPAGGEEDAA